MIFIRAVTLLLAVNLVAGFLADSGSRAVPTKRSENNERSLGLLTLWRLRPIFKTFNGYGSFGGSFGASFGGVGAGYNQFYPGSFAGGVGVGFPGVYPGGIHPIGYPAVGAQGPFNIRGNKPLERPTKSTIIEEGRVDAVIDDDPVTTIKPSLVQSIMEYTSPFFHAGQRIEARNRQKRFLDY